MSQTPNDPAAGNAPVPSSPAPTTPAVDSRDVPAAGTPSDDASARPPSRPRPRASGALVLLATLAAGFTLWAAQGLLLPVLLAMFFALVGNPFIRLLRRIYVPRFVSAILVLSLGMLATLALGRQLAQPAGEWIREAPRELRDLAPKLRTLTKPVTEANKAAENIARAAGGESSKPVTVVRTEVNDPYKVLTSTPRAIASVLAVVLLTFFFMVYGGDLQRNAIALLPSRQQKKLTVEILQSIETEISRYVLTISVIYLMMGLVFAGILHFALALPPDEALLWGTMAALLNFAPYVGPLIGILIMLLMGFVAFDDPLYAVLPAGIYLGLHALEGQLITPIVLGRRMALSPLILILALMVFGWLWGIIGLLLAVPLLVCVKIVLSKIEGMEGWAKLLE
jgi:predicted PurR-regulated permease PerM